MTATEWESSTMDPTGWFMSEKYDGMRLFWSGKNFYTRQGTKLIVPTSITNALPSIPLDGELWYVKINRCLFIIKDTIWIISRCCEFGKDEKGREMEKSYILGV